MMFAFQCLRFYGSQYPSVNLSIRTIQQPILCIQEDFVNSSYERFNYSSAGVKEPYERPSAFLTSPRQESGFVARDMYPSSNFPCDDCQTDP
jgi:hypothetical protein